MRAPRAHSLANSEQTDPVFVMDPFVRAPLKGGARTGTDVVRTLWSKRTAQ